MFDDDLTISYNVVINDEEQYSIWPEGQHIPAGWHPAGTTGSKQQCLDWIGTAWVDMRPRSARD